MGTLSVRYSERLIMRFGARTTLIPGLILIGLGLALFARVPVDGEYLRDILPAGVLLGAGVGAAFPTLMTLAMSGATQSDAGLASGLVNTTAQVGAAIGLAVLATLSETRTENLLADGEDQLAALTGGYHVGFIVGTALVAVAIAVAVVVIREAKPMAHPGADPGEATDAGQPDAASREPAYSEAG
jgi:MFS family permease